MIKYFFKLQKCNIAYVQPDLLVNLSLDMYVYITDVKLKSSLRKIYGRHHDFANRYGVTNIVVTKKHGYVLFVVITVRTFHHS